MLNKRIVLILSSCMILFVLFFGCSEVDESNEASCVTDYGYGILYDNSTGVTVLDLGDYLSIQDCDNVTSDFVLPTVFDEDKKITAIGEGFCSDTDALINVTIPDGYTYIDYFAFMYCDNLESVYIGKDISNIGEGAFTFCKNLRVFTVSEKNPYLYSDNNAIMEKDSNRLVISSGIIPAKTEIIGCHAFCGNSFISDVVLPENIKEIEFHGFCESSLTSIVLPDGLEIIGEEAFVKCNLKEIYIPESVTKIGSTVFSGIDGIVINFAGESLPENCDDNWLYGCENYIVNFGVKRNNQQFSIFFSAIMCMTTISIFCLWLSYQLTYDDIGNPLNWRNVSSFTWSGRQLDSLVTSSFLGIAYTYNSDGIRTKRVIESSYVYDYILDGTKILCETVTSNGTEQYKYHYLYDEKGSIIGFQDGTATYYYQKNLQGDIIRILNTEGVVLVQYTYNAFGEVLSVTGSHASTLGHRNPFRYRGYYYDSETGFYYLNSRYYDPTVGRFLNADAATCIGANDNIQGYNLFAYCSNNSIVYMDDSGYNAEVAAQWGATMWWLTGVDGPVPCGDLIYGGVLVLLLAFSPSVGITSVSNSNSNINSHTASSTETFGPYLSDTVYEPSYQSSTVCISPITSPSEVYGTSYADSSVIIVSGDFCGPLLPGTLVISDSPTVGSEEVYGPFLSVYDPDPYKKPGQKKQGRENKSAARKKKGWKPRNNRRDGKPRRVPKHTPGRDHRKIKQYISEANYGSLAIR